MTGRYRYLVTVWVIAIGGFVPATSADAAAGATSVFRPLPPTRVLDTRTGVGAQVGKPAAKSVTDLTIAGVAGVGPAVSAVMLNVTVTEATAPGFVQVFPTGGAVVGSTSNLNIEQAGGTVANLVVTKVSANGTVSLYTQAGAHLVADVLGWFEPAALATAGRFVSLAAPQRLVDTRDINGVPIVNPGDTKDCKNFATWTEANRWFWTYHRHGDVAHLDGNNDGVPCEALTGAPAQAQPPVDLFRLAATGSLAVPMGATATIPGGLLPAGASAAVINLTATAANVGYLQVVPTGGPTAFGASSNLNVTATGQTIPNLVTVPIGADGTITIYSQAGAHIVVDVVGYFTGPTDPMATDGLFTPIDPTRMLDTRTGIGAPATKPADATTITLAVADTTVIPASASAVFLNATITEANAPGYVQLYPAGRGTPGATSNLNVERAGQTRPNAVFTGLGDNGAVALYTRGGGHLLADVAGYFTRGEIIIAPTTPTGTVSQLLAALVIAPADHSVVYNRTDWGYPSDADGDCQDTRAEILQRDATGPVTLAASNCTVTAGTWLDPYTAATISDPRALEIDHVVPLAVAHAAGAATWPPARKAEFANDLTGRELRAVSATANQTKGDSTPDAWMPPNAADACSYVADWITIKATWQLTITQAEHDTLAAVLAGC